MSSSQPNTTLYVHNLNDKIHKDELRTQLLALFATYGKLVDIVARKGAKMKGQAFLVFTDLTSATAAMRACEGMSFYGKPMHIEYAKTKSYATLRREDPDFVSPSAANISKVAAEQNSARLQANAAVKRSRESESAVEGRMRKKERQAAEDEMEIEEDENESSRGSGAGVQSNAAQPTAHLLCTNLPPEVTSDMLSVLFQQYRGLQSTHVTPSPSLDANGQATKTAQVVFETPDLAVHAKEALDGFQLKRGWAMTVAYA